MINAQLKNTFKKSWITLKQYLNTKYPSWVTDKVVKHFQQALRVSSNTISKKENNNKKVYQLSLRY